MQFLNKEAGRKNRLLLNQIFLPAFQAERCSPPEPGIISIVHRLKNCIEAFAKRFFLGCPCRRGDGIVFVWIQEEVVKFTFLTGRRECIIFFILRILNPP